MLCHFAFKKRKKTPYLFFLLGFGRIQIILFEIIFVSFGNEFIEKLFDLCSKLFAILFQVALFFYGFCPTKKTAERIVI